MQNLINIEKEYNSLIRILKTPKNKISIAVMLIEQDNQNTQELLNKIGEKLYYHHISGAR